MEHGKQDKIGGSSSAAGNSGQASAPSVGKQTLVERATPRAAVWVDFQNGEWDGNLVLETLRGQTSVPSDLAAAILGGALATATFCVALRGRVDAAAATDPAQATACEQIHRSLSSRIIELVYATSHSPLQYRQMVEVAGWSTRFAAVPDSAPAGKADQKPTSTDTAAAAADRGKFADEYYRNGVLQASTLDKTMTYDKYKEAQGPLKSTSEMATADQRRRNPNVQTLSEPLDGDDLLFIYQRTPQTAPKDPAALTAWNTKNEQLKAQMPGINTAFRMMRLDTAGAQGHYLANAYMESSQLEFMTETQKAAHDKPFQDTGNAKLDTGWLDDAKDGNANGLKVTGYEPGGSVNKAGTKDQDDWDKSFIGRGPIQVTHDWGYLQTLAVMESRLDELEKMPPDAAERADLPLLAEALRAIKADPRMAADRRYTFLFSAAAMKRRMPSDKVAGKWNSSLDSQIVNSSDPAITGMGDHSQLPESKATKDAVFARAVQRITEKNKAAAKQVATP